MTDLEHDLLEKAASFTTVYPGELSREEKVMAQLLVNGGLLAPVNSLKLTPEGWKRWRFLEDQPTLEKEKEQC
jgi:hypothetical protein